MTNQPICMNCDSLGWVCENHTDRPWGDGGSTRSDACACGAGAPCPVCNPCDRDHSPRDVAGSTLIWDLEHGYRH